MITAERIPMILIEGQKQARSDFRTCVAGSRFKVWTDSAFSDHLVPLYRTLNPRIAVIDLASTPQVEGGPAPVKAIQDLVKEFPDACVVVTYNIEKKYLLNTALSAGARGHIPRPYTAGRVVEGIGLAIASHDQTTEKRRQAVRVPAKLDFFYKEAVNGKPWSPTRQVHTEDVCEAGARVRMDRTFEAGDEMKVGLRLQQQGPPMWMRGRVAHCTQVNGLSAYDLGFSFVEIEEQHKEIIRGYVREQISNGYLL